jgi:SAM-dependent methyltransferase
MNSPPRLTDRSALELHRARAAAAPVSFLQEAVADEVHERLTEVNRTFTAPLIVTGHPHIWVDRMPQAKVIADRELLEVAPGEHDLVIHALSLHWAQDLVGQLVQCRRALQPDGLFIGTLFGGQTLHELRAALAQAESELTGGLSPRIAPMAEIRDLGGLLQRAGFALPVADATPFHVTYSTPLHLMRDLRGMGENNALAGRLRHLTRRAVILRACEIYQQNFAQDDRVGATFEVVTLTGWAPAATQPKALRPGTATHRLADALGTSETTIPDPKD